MNEPAPPERPVANAPVRPYRTGDRVILSLGKSRVYGIFQRYEHGGLSVFVAVEGYEKHHAWFPTPPWTLAVDNDPLAPRDSAPTAHSEEA